MKIIEPISELHSERPKKESSHHHTKEGGGDGAFRQKSRHTDKVIVVGGDSESIDIRRVKNSNHMRSSRNTSTVSSLNNFSPPKT